MSWWVVGMFASAVISLAFLAIAGIIFRGLRRTGSSALYKDARHRQALEIDDYVVPRMVTEKLSLETGHLNEAAAVQPVLTRLDLSMPGMDELEAQPLIEESAPGTSAVVVSAFDRSRAVPSALDLGATAYLEKGCSPRDLIRQLLVLGSEPAPQAPTPAPGPIVDEMARATDIDRCVNGLPDAR